MSSTAGELLKWFVEDGAFHLHPDNTHADQYCDIQHLLSLLESLDVKVCSLLIIDQSVLICGVLKISGPIVDTIYNPLHLLLTKAKVAYYQNHPLLFYL